MFLSIANKSNIVTQIKSNIDFEKNIFLSTLKGLINDTNPKINPVLQIIDPTALPKLIVVCPSNDANNYTVSSGKVVAKLTIVAPNIISDIFVFFPISTVQFINISAPFVISINPIKNNIILINIYKYPLILNRYSIYIYICYSFNLLIKNFIFFYKYKFKGIIPGYIFLCKNI